MTDTGETAEPENPHAAMAVIMLWGTLMGAMALVGGWFVPIFSGVLCVAFILLGVVWKASHFGSSVTPDKT